MLIVAYKLLISLSKKNSTFFFHQPIVLCCWGANFKLLNFFFILFTYIYRNKLISLIVIFLEGLKLKTYKLVFIYGFTIHSPYEPNIRIVGGDAKCIGISQERRRRSRDESKRSKTKYFSLYFKQFVDLPTYK